MGNTREILVAIDEGTNECMYVDGVRFDNNACETVDACDIAEAAGDDPIRFTHQAVDLCETKDSEPRDWPESLDDLRPWFSP